MMVSPDYCLFWIDWWPLCMQKSEWAAWVAALGAIAAILGAVGVVLLQQHLARRERTREMLHLDFTRIEGARRLARAGANVCGKIADALESGSSHDAAVERGKMMGELESICHSMKAIAAHEFAAWEVTEAVITNFSALRSLERMLAEHGQSIDRNYPTRALVRESAKQALGELDKREQLLADYLWASHPEAAAAVIKDRA